MLVFFFCIFVTWLFCVEDMNGDIGVVIQAWLMDLSQRLANGVKLRDLLLNMRDGFQNMLIARCYGMVQFILGVATLKANVRKSMGVCKAPC